MGEYKFIAKTLAGKQIKGVVEADNEQEAKSKIRSRNMIPLQILPSTGSSLKKKSFGGSKSSNSSASSLKVKTKELQVFTRQFAVLIEAGIPIVQSLEAMIGTGRSPNMNTALEQVLGGVGKGKKLAESMTPYNKIFNKLYVGLIRAGEEGGILDDILKRLADYIEKSVKLRGKVTGALWYPAIIVVVAGIVIAAILVFVIPSFVKMFQDNGTELPYLTQIVIALSENVQSYWYIYIGGTIGGFVALKSYYQTSEGKKVIDAYLIRFPLFGTLIQKSAIARFSRTISTLLTSGVRILDALDIAADTTGNYVIEKTVLGSKNSITQGRTFSEPLKKSKYIPDMVSQMIAIGEQTGSLDVMFEKIADFYEDEVEATADAMTSLIEPLLMVFLGGIIAVLVIAMYLPIFSLAGAIGG